MLEYFVNSFIIFSSFSLLLHGIALVVSKTPSVATLQRGCVRVCVSVREREEGPLQSHHSYSTINRFSASDIVAAASLAAAATLASTREKNRGWWEENREKSVDCISLPSFLLPTKATATAALAHARSNHHPGLAAGCHHRRKSLRSSFFLCLAPLLLPLLLCATPSLIVTKQLPRMCPAVRRRE